MFAYFVDRAPQRDAEPLVSRCLCHSLKRVYSRAVGLKGAPSFGFRNRLELYGFMQIIVRDNNVDQALRALKKKLQREGVYREMKLRRHYEKPSEKRAREKAAAIRRARKMERKVAERDNGK